MRPKSQFLKSWRTDQEKRVHGGIVLDNWSWNQLILMIWDCKLIPQVSPKRWEKDLDWRIGGLEDGMW